MATVIVLVGCSRGFGRALLRACLSNHAVTRPGERIVYVLITTDERKMRDTWNEMYFEVKRKHFIDDRNSGIEALIEESDLGNMKRVLDLCEVLRIMFGHFHFIIDKFFLFLNSGSINPVGPVVESPSEASPHRSISEFSKQLEAHCTLNFSSQIVLVRHILQSVLQRKPRSLRLEIRIVHVSSLAAIQPIYGISVYGAIKAAKEHFLRSLCMEIHRDHPSVHARILNYAPGPMDTELVRRELLDACNQPNDVRDGTHTFVDPDSSASKCLKILLQSDDAWENGAHVDYYDVVE